LFPGYAGQNALEGPLSKEAAQEKFRKKFKSKTSVEWKDRDSSVPNPKKYHYIQTAYDFKVPNEDPSTFESSPTTIIDRQMASEHCALLPRNLRNEDGMAKKLSEVIKHVSIYENTSLMPYLFIFV
jgi:hypothetical protein